MKDFPRGWGDFCRVALLASTTVLTAGCSSAPSEEAALNGDELAAVNGMTAAQKARAERITSLFEFGEPRLRYDDVEYLDDGRGLTIGRAGFTTANGDFLLVAERYVRAVPRSPLAGYLPRLRELAKTESPSVTGLGLTKYVADGEVSGGIATLLRGLGNDATYRAKQDSVSDELYFTPAMKRASAVGLRTALGRAIHHRPTRRRGRCRWSAGAGRRDGADLPEPRPGGRRAPVACRIPCDSSRPPRPRRRSGDPRRVGRFGLARRCARPVGHREEHEFDGKNHLPRDRLFGR